MATPIATTRWNDLLNLFDTLSALHEQLLTLIRTKIEAMRKNDVPAMQDLTDQEHRLAGRIQDREGFRRQLMDSIGREAGWAAGAARVMPVSQLANHLPELQREVLLEKAGALRRIISRVADANRLAAAVGGAGIQDGLGGRGARPDVVPAGQALLKVAVGEQVFARLDQGAGNEKCSRRNDQSHGLSPSYATL